MKERSHECPVCGSRLRGDRFSGYGCPRCHAHYSARFIAHLRREQLKGLIAKHFERSAEPPAAVTVETEEFVIPQEDVRQAMDDAREAAGRSVKHLEEILDATSAAQERIDEVGIAVEAPVTGRIAVGTIVGRVEHKGAESKPLPKRLGKRSSERPGKKRRKAPGKPAARRPASQARLQVARKAKTAKAARRKSRR